MQNRVLASATALGGFLIVAGAQLALVVVPVLLLLSMLPGRTALRLGVPVCIATVGVMAYATWRALHTRRREPIGIPVARPDAPQLWALLDGAAAAAGTRAPDRVTIVADATAKIIERTHLLGLIGGRRDLYLGLPLLQAWDEAHLRAVAAHELGHFSPRLGRLAPLAYRGRVAVARTVPRISRRNPAGPLIQTYAKFYRRVDAPFSRAQELAADRIAAEYAGRTTAMAVLRDLPALDALQRIFHAEYLGPGWQAGHVPDDIFGGFLRVLAARANDVAVLRARDPGTPPAWDTHPPVADRLAALALTEAPNTKTGAASAQADATQAQAGAASTQAGAASARAGAAQAQAGGASARAGATQAQAGGASARAGAASAQAGGAPAQAGGAPAQGEALTAQAGAPSAHAGALIVEAGAPTAQAGALVAEAGAPVAEGEASVVPAEEPGAGTAGPGGQDVPAASGLSAGAPGDSAATGPGEPAGHQAARGADPDAGAASVPGTGTAAAGAATRAATGIRDGAGLGAPAGDLVPDLPGLGRALQGVAFPPQGRTTVGWDAFFGVARTVEMQREADAALATISRAAGEPVVNAADVLDLAADGRLHKAAESVFTGLSDEDTAGRVAELVTLLLALAALRSGAARWRHSWTGSAELVAADSSHLDLGGLAAQASDPATVAAARERLAALGIDAAAAPGAEAAQARPEVVGGVVNLVVDGARTDVLIVDTGLFLVPGLPRSQNGSAKRRLARFAAADAPQRDADVPGSRFVPYAEVAGATRARRRSWDLSLRDGGTLRLRTALDSDELPGGWAALDDAVAFLSRTR
ncbi:M48 family metalloprotease [Amorphoplanes digitatis]|uniref:Zn-dependent protease with chaperone function n=1 Tax=Actinoplanes digitatis TaxID=1868 RepID=A0A7W7I4I9_9ACTN|nr:M48 family metallopeptidase [Actinoplanes digitatis]MBB4766098.1 Zn-dependent protease with chaperone function [Actinoplanes digitatis]